MKHDKFKSIGISIPRFQIGTSNNGIQLLEYNGPQYYQIQEQMKKEDPQAYNRLQIEVAKNNQPNSEIIWYKDSNGKYRTTTNVEAGYVSGIDPVGKLVTETVTLSKPMQWIGKGIQYVGLNLPGIQKLLTHPTWKKIYHGTRKDFTWKEAKPYSLNNTGLHVSPNKKIAESFSLGPDNKGRVMEGYAPKPQVETIDIWDNNYNLLSTKYKIDARPKGSGSYYYTKLPDTKRIKMLKDAGAEPSIELKQRSIRGSQIYGLHTEKPAHLNLRSNLDLSKEAQEVADDILKRSQNISHISKIEAEELSRQLNRETAELLSKEGMRSIKYNNIALSEGGGGESWIITDSSIVWNPTWKSLNFNPRLERLAPIIPFTHD